MPEVSVPALAANPAATGRVVAWLIDDGVRVDEWDAVAQVEIAGLEIDLLAPADGWLRHEVKTDAGIAANDVIAVIGVEENAVTPKTDLEPTTHLSGAPGEVAHWVCTVDVTALAMTRDSMHVRLIEAVVRAIADSERHIQVGSASVNIEVVNEWSAPTRVFIDRAELLSRSGLAAAVSEGRTIPTEGTAYIRIYDLSNAVAVIASPPAPLTAAWAVTFGAPHKSPHVVTDVLGNDNLAIRSLVYVTVSHVTGAITAQAADRLCRSIIQHCRTACTTH
jgi:pyruvate/2-oxoglutarate dehydrogenase complex dihydrolipoamide acyltransferase (E2) component